MTGVALLALLLPAADPSAWALADPVAVDLRTHTTTVDFCLAGEPPENPPAHQCVLIFTAWWCGPCKTMRQVAYPALTNRGWRIEDYGKSSSTKEPHIVLVDVDKHAELTERFDVKSYPTIVSWNGTKETGRTVGGLDAWGIGKAWDKKPGEGVSRSTPRRYSARWSFPGDTREELIEHLNGPSHNYTKESLQKMSTDALFRLHDNDHETQRTTSQPRPRSFFGIFRSRG